MNRCLWLGCFLYTARWTSACQTVISLLKRWPRWLKPLFGLWISVFYPAHWSPVGSCLPVFVCVSVHVSLPPLLFALLHVITLSDSAAGYSCTGFNHSETVPLLKAAFSLFLKFCLYFPRANAMLVLCFQVVRTWRKFDVFSLRISST